MANDAEQIQRLTRQKRGRGRLGEAADREALEAAESEAVPGGTDPSEGWASPLVEQAYTGSTYYSLVSSDGLFIFEYADLTDYLDDDGGGVTRTFKHLDRTPTP